MDMNASLSCIAAIRRLLADLEHGLQGKNTDAAVVTSAYQTLTDSLVKELQSLQAALGTKPDAKVVELQDKSALAIDSKLLSITLRNITDAVVTVDAEGRVVLLNNAAEVLTECTLQNAVGKPIDEIVLLFEERDHLKRCKDYTAVIANHEGQGNEFRALLRSQSGKELMVTVAGSRITEQGRYMGTVLVLRDISRNYFLEEEVLKIRKLESVGVLAGGIAHDFNNLLTGITTNLFMARMSVVGNNEACSLISEAEKAAFKATTLTKQLLSFARGRPSIKEVTSIKQLIQDTVGFCLSGSNVDYRLELPNDLKPVEIDKGQIDQVLNNLISNAVQAMPHGGTITITASNTEVTGDLALKTLPLQKGKYVKVSIHDEGMGISHEHLERIFDPYFSTRDEGTGLGLSTAYSIIKRHGGHLYVESTGEKGSVFTFLLPIMESGESPSKTNDILVKGSGRVLIMDDDLIVRTVVETLLKKTGYSPVCVTNGDQALNQYREALAGGDPFTVTIMDLTIPGGMGGKETVKRLREIDKAAKVIVFSGYSNDPIFSNFKEYGFDGVLSKPFSIEEFMRTISLVLKERPALAQ
jgi:PAS domain S-box-containing protein